MASTKAQERASKKYYDTHKSYRDKKIAKQVAKQKANPKKHNKEQREYYKKDAEYREYKKKYAKKYRKEEPIKSKAIKDRPKRKTKASK